MKVYISYADIKLRKPNEFEKRIRTLSYASFRIFILYLEIILIKYISVESFCICISIQFSSILPIPAGILAHMQKKRKKERLNENKNLPILPKKAQWRRFS